MSVNRLVRGLQRFEDGLLVSILLSMLSLAFAQIVMRNLFNSGMVWSEPLIKILVLWTALLGAMVATRNHNHINIDILSRFLPPRLHTAQQRLIHAISGIVCMLLAWESLRFVVLEWEEENIAFASVPAWIPELILPIGFFSMAMRYLLHSLHPHKRPVT